MNWGNIMNKKEFSNFGNDIRKKVNDSLNSNDYRKLGQEVGKNVSDTLETVIEEVKRTVGTIQIENEYLKTKVVNNNAYKSTNIKKSLKPLKTKAKTNLSERPKQVYFPHVQVGKVEAVLLTVFGSIGVGTFGILLVVFGLVGFGPWVVGSMFAGTLVSYFMMEKAAWIRKRNKRYKRYLEFFYGKDSASVPELASYCNVSDKFLLRDLRKMIDKGMFPQGHINDHNSMMMLTHNSYKRYMDELRAIQNKKVKEITTSGNFEHDNAIEEGRKSISQINSVASNIQDVEVSSKILRMEKIIEKIIDYINEHPNQLSDVRKFMRYYLPTTLKLLNAYQEFESQPIQGENITTAKYEIKDALDTINLAYENLFDDLFASASMDISADISVLNIMLAQEGLTEQDFDISKTEGGNNNE